jgi:hypothetical protein
VVHGRGGDAATAGGKTQGTEPCSPLSTRATIRSKSSRSAGLAAAATAWIWASMSVITRPRGRLGRSARHTSHSNAIHAGMPIASAEGDNVIHDPILSQCQLGFAGVVAGETFSACAYLKPWTPLCSSRATDRSTRSRDDGPMLGVRRSPSWHWRSRGEILGHPVPDAG